MKKKYVQNGKFLYWFGNLLMSFGVFLLLFTYYPLLVVYFFPDKNILPTEYSDTPVISIPKISASAPIIENVDPWSESTYLEALKSGVAHASGTSAPGEGGTMYLFAHSSDLPWRITKYNTAFFRLGELDHGDKIYIDNDLKRTEYKVVDIIEVDPSEVEFLENDFGDILILQTCTPVGTSLRRLLVFAEPLQ